MLRICIEAISINTNEIQKAAEKAIVHVAACCGLCFYISNRYCFICKSHLVLPTSWSNFLTSSHLISLYITHLISSHFIQPHITSSHLFSLYITSPHINLPHLSSPHHINKLIAGAKEEDIASPEEVCLLLNALNSPCARLRMSVLLVCKPLLNHFPILIQYFPLFTWYQFVFFSRSIKNLSSFREVSKICLLFEKCQTFVYFSRSVKNLSSFREVSKICLLFEKCQKFVFFSRIVKNLYTFREMSKICLLFEKCQCKMFKLSLYSLWNYTHSN